ncbi:unnamed protein product (macronuclear) [Paramecium tetraurelia]|uniref:Uncharacterized protein n=1 Tax=Paramecium tetraurelia TaxID=5888 RepID=A0E0E0_PARTE|nr:uncharacterized protein GSPATT00021925001 [Paramecium tetraurelia]CAK88757.1 unnamed protein product [Paramecium tetraurelia]|eukprot:XP_001456154.1 hypothetical protein (macronuclear) [Paramecium tetraurelia strain d4-2]
MPNLLRGRILTGTKMAIYNQTKQWLKNILIQRRIQSFVCMLICYRYQTALIKDQCFQLQLYLCTQLKPESCHKMLIIKCLMDRWIVQSRHLNKKVQVHFKKGSSLSGQDLEHLLLYSQQFWDNYIHIWNQKYMINLFI